MGTLIAHPESKEKSDALKAFMKALKIRFEEEKSPYNAEFVEKIKRSEEDFKVGRFKAIRTDDLWK
ncbi:DUF2683 family protein [Mucilaginibacter gotjawali]|uniref:Uncharacterized protein n=1 Tax=Mucilaginibacter gotjawali TaxID=1550579 RepID=A0A839SBY3_9SPHI|nr:DUF2683 family protein [Mucilaginibacter gotjawali]MBB3054834.1 hypothetical protein [Mucilaginibacter gotjawali]